MAAGRTRGGHDACAGFRRSGDAPRAGFPAEPAGRGPGRPAAPLLRRSDQGQDRRHHVHLHELHRHLPDHHRAHDADRGQARRCARPRHLHRLADGRPGERHAGEAEGLFESLQHRPWLDLRDRKAGRHPRDQLPARRTQQGAERAPQRDRARQRRHRRMAARQRDGRSRARHDFDPRDGSEIPRSGSPGARQSGDEHGPRDGHAARAVDVQEDLHRLPHHWRRRQGRPGPARRHRAARPRLAGAATCAIRSA